MRPVCQLIIFLLFTLLFLIIWLNINVLILLKEPLIEKAVLTVMYPMSYKLLHAVVLSNDSLYVFVLEYIS